jgi:CheY-like chemotaxis protein
MNILLIDDDEVTNYINKRIFCSVYPDSNITVAGNGSEALTVIENNISNALPIFDLILVDISMPDMDGWEFIDAVSENKYILQHKGFFFMLTSSVFDDDIIKAQSKPFIKKFFSKPLDIEKIKEMVELC